VNKGLKLLLLALLVKPAPGFGQQQPASSLESLVAAAQQAQAAHDYAAAENAYRQALRIEPNMPELWANLGLMEQQAGDIPGALQSFSRANRLNPSLYVPNLFLGIDNLRAGKAAQAIPFLVNAVKTNKSDPQAPLALGRAYISTEKFSAAAQQLTRATALDPKLGQAWFALGMARLDQVEQDARKMTIEGKDSSFAGAIYAESLEKQARFGEAASLYRSLLNSNPQPPCLRSELGISLTREHEQTGAASEFAAERAAHPECGLALLGQARIALDSNENERAVELLNELWSRDHGFVESNAAILLEGLPGEKASAVAASLTQASSLVPDDLRNALLAAFNVSNQDSKDRAVGTQPAPPQVAGSGSASNRTANELYTAGQFRQCELLLDAAPVAGNADKLRQLAECAFFAGDNQRASSAATALEALQPHSLEALYWAIQANERLALESLGRFQQLDPDSAKSHVLLGDIYHQLERYDDAQTEYMKALALEPGDPAAMLGLASAYLSNNNIEKAVETAQSALARSPDDPELNLIMAEALLSRNQYAQAEPYLLKSLHSKPQMLPHVHALIGKVDAETGRTQEAIAQLKLGASSDEDGSLQYLLARLYREIGDNKDAAEALDRMKTIKQKRRERGVKTVEDPDLSSLESLSGEASTP
jgi:tetratricopeptide (TPR) repeat protein